MKKKLLIALLMLAITPVFAQNSHYWQQRVNYKMDVNIDVENYQYKGKQQLIYTNNSPDTLQKVYFHLYNNAFQPGTEMDTRLQNIKDPDLRMVNKLKKGGVEIKESRIKDLKSNEIGYLHVKNLKQDGAEIKTKELETVLEVILAKPMLPNSKTTFTLDFEGQVPLSIRRSGRNNKESVELSMAQWYPKIAEFDYEGWHADPYIAREFHGVWGDFDVKITIDKDYIVGGTGYLQNKNEIGYGYQDPGVKIKKTDEKKLTWHFFAPMVHDFTFAADKNYLHDVVKGPNNVDLHFLYKNDPKYIQNWKDLAPKAVELMNIFNKKVGNYPYKQYSIIQGGDGGMEYAMCTLILGGGDLEGLTRLTAHEMGHSWFQHILASNESKNAWMDEGFTSFIQDYALNEIASKKVENPYEVAYKNYISMANSGKEMPLTTHSDRFDENRLYSISSYSKGEVFLAQLGYLIGQDNLMKTLKRYYNDFKFKHPTPNDIKRTAERVTGANLDWYLNDWTKTTNTIDYSIKDVIEKENTTMLVLHREDRIPMPIDITVTYLDNSKENFYIPLRMMNFEKPNPNPEIKRTVLPDWAWAYPAYEFVIPVKKENIKKIVIDPSGLMADVNNKNNIYEK